MSWFEHTIEGAEYDIGLSGHWDPVKGFEKVEGWLTFDDHTVDLSPREVEEMIERHRQRIEEAILDGMLPADP